MSGRDWLNILLGIVFMYAGSWSLLMFGPWAFLIIIPATVMLVSLGLITKKENEENDKGK